MLLSSQISIGEEDEPKIIKGISQTYRYFTRDGDTLNIIAHRCHVNTKVLLMINKLFVFTLRVSPFAEDVPLKNDQIILVPCIKVKVLWDEKDWYTGKVVAERKGKGFLIEYDDGSLVWEWDLSNGRNIITVEQSEKFGSPTFDLKEGDKVAYEWNDQVYISKFVRWEKKMISNGNSLTNVILKTAGEFNSLSDTEISNISKIRF